MAVDTTTRKQTFAGGQTTLTFSFATLVDHPEYIKGIKTLTSSSTETDLVYDVDYTVALESDGSGGVVTMTPSVSTAYTVTIYRETENKQESDYDDYNQFPADTLESDLDRRTMVEQELSEAIDRSIKLPLSSSIDSVVLPLPEDGLTLAWSGTGGTLVNIPVPTGSTGATGPSGSTGAPGGTGEKGIFTNATVTTGSLLITYSSIGTSGVLTIIIANSNGVQCIPDDITFADTGATVNVTSFMPIGGTWRYYYIK